MGAFSSAVSCKCALKRERFICSTASADCRSLRGRIDTFWKLGCTIFLNTRRKTSMRNCKAFLLRSNICQNAPKPIQNASQSAFVKRRSSSGVWNAVARKRHKSNRQLKRRSFRSMGSPATRAALMRWINCSTRSLIGWRFGESLQRKLITVVFLM